MVKCFKTIELTSDTEKDSKQIRKILNKNGWQFFKINHSPIIFGHIDNLVECLTYYSKLFLWKENKDKHNTLIKLTATSNLPTFRNILITRITLNDFIHMINKSFKSLDKDIYYLLEPNSEIEIEAFGNIGQSLMKIFRGYGWNYCNTGKFGVFGEVRKIVSFLREYGELFTYHQILLITNHSSKISKIVVSGGSKVDYQFTLGYMSEKLFEKKIEDAVEIKVPIGGVVYKYNDIS